jgi:hypothetical protein
MKRIALLLLAVAALAATPALAAEPPDSGQPQEAPQAQDTAQGQTPAAPADPCAVPEHITHVDGKLPRVALMAKERAVNILVEGTGSSVIAGPEGARNAYPARLEAALAARLPNVKVTVATDVRPRRTTADMVKALASLPPEVRPGLVVWQTGTFDAMRGVDPDEFRTVLEKGVRKLQSGGIDVILVNMQYSPRTEAMITVGPFAEAMRVVAQQTDAPLFDRLAAMKHWSETGVFDFSGSDRSTKLAERVHDCIGKLLAEVIFNAAGLDKKHVKESR